MTPLPAVAFEISRWLYGRRVGRNGHVVFERNFYSAPLAHIGTKVDVRITARTLEIYRGTERISSHLLLPADASGQYRTNDADLPAGRQYQQWDAPRVRAWTERVGPTAVIVINRIFESVPVDEQGLDAALAVLRLSRRFSAERVEAACSLALTGRCAHPATRISAWPPARTRLPPYGHARSPSRPAGTSAAPTTTPGVPDEQHR